MSLKKVFATLLLSTSALIASPGYANICGIGKVVQVREGLLDTDDLYIEIDYSVEGPAAGLAGTFFRQDWIVFKSESLVPERLRAIRALAYLAFASDELVYIWTHNPLGCIDSTELGVFKEDVNPRN